MLLWGHPVCCSHALDPRGSRGGTRSGAATSLPDAGAAGAWAGVRAAGEGAGHGRRCRAAGSSAASGTRGAGVAHHGGRHGSDVGVLLISKGEGKTRAMAQDCTCCCGLAFCATRWSTVGGRKAGIQHHLFDLIAMQLHQHRQQRGHQKRRHTRLSLAPADVPVSKRPP